MERGEGKDRGVRRAHTDQDFVLQWGYRKRLRCVKPQVKDEAANEKAKESYVLRRQPSRHDHRVLR